MSGNSYFVPVCEWFASKRITPLAIFILNSTESYHSLFGAGTLKLVVRVRMNIEYQSDQEKTEESQMGVRVLETN